MNTPMTNPMPRIWIIIPCGCSWVYMIEQQKWIPYEDSFIADPQFGRPPTVWNQSCIACHAVGGQPHYQAEEDRYDIEFHSNIADYGISCEARYGPENLMSINIRLSANTNVESEKPILRSLTLFDSINISRPRFADSVTAYSNPITLRRFLKMDWITNWAMTSKIVR